MGYAWITRESMVPTHGSPVKHPSITDESTLHGLLVGPKWVTRELKQPVDRPWVARRLPIGHP